MRTAACVSSLFSLALFPCLLSFLFSRPIHVADEPSPHTPTCRPADPPTHHYRHAKQSTVFTYTSSSQDLCAGTYYTHAVPAIDLQLAKQGYRLAAWLNVIFDGDVGLP